MMTHRFLSSQTVSIIGAGYAGGQPRAGVERGPAAIRAAGLLEEIKALGWTIADQGDLEFERVPEDSVGKVKNPSKVGKANEKIFKVNSEATPPGSFLLTIGNSSLSNFQISNKK
jgi:arginase